ncbi:MAG: 50S ribosomal protein L10 [Cytophagales bacterium]|nr:50S ribosomal protein L10 [Bernardetiaceae bacterium]MDW8210414.1 50S ribosomal protein L10 [Cytophagales bacterium]
MTKEEKFALVEELTEKLANTPNFYITDASGMTVAEVNAFRRLCYQKGVEYRVVKNTLIKKALQGLGKGDFRPFEEKVLKGFSGIMFSPENPKLPAEILKEFRQKSGNKDHPKPLFKGASIDYDLFIGEDQLETLSNLKSKTDLIGEIISLLQSPIRNVLGALQSGGTLLHGILTTLEEKGKPSEA